MPSQYLLLLKYNQSHLERRHSDNRDGKLSSNKLKAHTMENIILSIFGIGLLILTVLVIYKYRQEKALAKARLSELQKLITDAYAKIHAIGRRSPSGKSEAIKLQRNQIEGANRHFEICFMASLGFNIKNKLLARDVDQIIARVRPVKQELEDIDARER